MDERIIGRQRTVAQIFADELRLVLPYFQRGYAWRKEHAERLLDDVRAMAEGEGDLDWYPLGQIIVAKRTDSPDAWVADGHQRLITLTILIAVLRDLEADAKLRASLEACIVEALDGGGRRFRLSTLESARDTLVGFVQEADATKRPIEDLEVGVAESARNIVENRDFLRAQLEAIGRRRRRVVATFLLERCVLFVNAVEKQEVARMMFETMHDRGLKPTTNDLFKAQVLGTVRDDARDACRSAWENIEASLGTGRLDDLLGHIAVIGTRSFSKKPAQQVLGQRFDLDEASGAQSFVERQLRPLGGLFAAMYKAERGHGPLPDALKRRLQYLAWIRNHDTWAMPLLH